jgi:protease I
MQGRSMRVLIPLPNHDFDPTEAAVPWQVLSDAGHEVLFATPDGGAAAADDRVLGGRGLGPFRPLLVAAEDARRAYGAMARAPRFSAPLPYAALAAERFDAMVLPGGHAQGMRPYLESRLLQTAAREHLAHGAPLGAICHGVLVLARAVDPATGRSALYGRRTTALLRSMELSAWGLTCAWLGNYYRTYPEPVEEEVTRALSSPADFVAGPFALRRDGPDRLTGFAHRDGNYVSARWPGDAFTFAHRLAALL